MTKKLDKCVNCVFLQENTNRINMYEKHECTVDSEKKTYILEPKKHTCEEFKIKKPT